MDYKIDDFSYMGSTVGNAFHSGLAFPQLLSCLELSKNVEEFDAAVSATCDLMDIMKRKYGC